jgi:hypothetical protein
MLLKNPKTSKSLVFSRQGIPVASGLLLRVDAVLLLSLDKTPMMLVLISRHKTTTEQMLF